MLTKGRFTEWNRLLCLCNISLFSSQGALRSFLKIALRPWRKNNKKEITMKGSSPDRIQSEIWYRRAVRSHQRRHLRRNLQAQGCSDPKITNWGMQQERWEPVPTIKKKALLSTTEWRTPKRGTRKSDREQHRGRPWHGSWARHLKILQLVQVALCLLLKVGMLAMAWKRKETAALFTIQYNQFSVENLEKKALIHDFEENLGFMVISTMPLNIDKKMIRSSNFQEKCFCALRLPDTVEAIPMT